MSFRYPLATSSWDQAEYDAIQRVIASGMFTMGANVLEFERRFADYVGSPYCIMVNSGSSANLLMVAALFFTENPALRLKPGDEIIVPAISWSTTYYPLHQYGLKLRFVDIDLGTLNYDLAALAEAVSDTTRAIMAVNLLGNPNDFGAIRQIIGDRCIVLIEDNCESMGAELGGRQCGTFGVAGSFSSFFSHHISTMEGGLVATADEELYHIMLSLRAHGWTRNLPRQNRVTRIESDDPFTESFRFILPGYNLRPLELSGAIGIEQVAKLPRLIAERRRNGALFQQVIGQHPDLLIQTETGSSSWFGFSLVIRPGSTLTRPALIARLGEIGFECRPIVSGNFTKNEVMRHLNAVVPASLPNAEHVDSCGLFIGNQHFPIDEAIHQLAKI
jgi:CDP-6-deoxy-D-xylo-4-hexulose-3-dehydrase